MKNILVLAEGLSAKHFIERINQKRVGDNRYTIVSPKDIELPAHILVDMEFHTFDPTSYSKLRNMIYSIDFSSIYIILDSADESREVLQNVRIISEKLRVFLVDTWDAFTDIDNIYTKVFNLNQLIANRLFDHLPNMPMIAQNVGLSEGEIIQVTVPFGSSFSYRHIGSISQVKWKIAAIYRAQKLILPTAGTMLKPQDALLLIGKPNVLSNIHARISNKDGKFPEPFGRNLYLIMDMGLDCDELMNYLQESIYLLERLDEKQLIVRVINPGDFTILEKIKEYRSDKIEINIEYGNVDIDELITADIQHYNIGLILASSDLFKKNRLGSKLYDLRKLVYIFGDTPLYTVEKSIILMENVGEMESISSTSFYISETLGLNLCLCNFDPEGDFDSRKTIVEHYETLSHATQYPIKIKEEKANPIRKLNSMNSVLQIAPLKTDNNRSSFWSLFSSNVEDFLMSSNKHPKLLIPVVLD